MDKLLFTQDKKAIALEYDVEDRGGDSKECERRAEGEGWQPADREIREKPPCREDESGAEGEGDEMPRERPRNADNHQSENNEYPVAGRKRGLERGAKREISDYEPE